VQIDTVSSPEKPGFVELGISPARGSRQYSRRLLSNCGLKEAPLKEASSICSSRLLTLSSPRTAPGFPAAIRAFSDALSPGALPYLEKR